MQAPDIVTAVSPEKANAMLPLPYVYEGLSVQGVSPTRLTPYPNPMMEVPDEVGRAIGLRNVAKRLTESRIAIALVGLGLRPADLTVRAHVRVLTISAGLARVGVSTPQTQPTPTPKPEPPFKLLQPVRCTQCKLISDLSEWKETTFYCEDCNDDHTGVACPNEECYCVDGPGSSGYMELPIQTSTTDEYAAQVKARVDEGVRRLLNSEVEL